ncbi:MAG TPA: hypothetical protein VHA77_16405 [Xanthobacteraceae bacterium]|jgi:hypothetical protein|nr:hypothetical protein [Xanthobacteraceae bacterium]
MSVSDPARRANNPYAWIEQASKDLWSASEHAIEHHEAGLVSDEAVARIMTAALKLYVAKSDGEERTFPPLIGPGDQHITATEVLSAVAEILRALRLGPMELALWYRRRPDEE